MWLLFMRRRDLRGREKKLDDDKISAWVDYALYKTIKCHCVFVRA